MLALWQWRHGFAWPWYGALLFLTLGVGVIHHNHPHVWHTANGWMRA